MSIFNDLRNYQTKWEEKGRRNFTPQEIAEIDEAVVVASQYGFSGRFQRKNGYIVFIPMSQTCSLGEGESIDMQKAVIVTLSKLGENDIFRIEI